MRLFWLTLVALGAVPMLTSALPALGQEWQHSRQEWREPEWREHHFYRPGFYAPPVVAAPSGYGYVPPPAYYGYNPGYAYSPGVSLGVTIR